MRCVGFEFGIRHEQFMIDVRVLLIYFKALAHLRFEKEADLAFKVAIINGIYLSPVSRGPFEGWLTF